MITVLPEVPRSVTKTLRPLLSRYGDRERPPSRAAYLDVTTFSPEIGPLVTYFPSPYVGAPCWVLDAPDAMHVALSAVRETGLGKLGGFVDDARSLCGIGAGQDVA